MIRHHWRHFDTSSARLLTLSKALSPAYLRFGGTAADFLIFNRTEEWTEGHWKYKGQDDIHSDHDSYGWGEDGDIETPVEVNFTMTAADFDKLNRFAAAAGWRLLFDFNVLLRNGSQWESSNARQILQYAVTQKYNDNMDFELGNEPNAFHHALNRTLPATQLGKDFLMMRDLLFRGAFQPYFNKSRVVGPDTTRAKKGSLKYAAEFLGVVQNAVDVITWHQYYINGRTATIEDFLDADTLDLLAQQINAYSQTFADAGLSNKKVWLGETGSAWGGGAPGLSDRYVAGFLYLDKLGLAARMGLDSVMRQSFFGGNYAMVDNDIQPRPDLWLGVLYKRLVGQQVLDVETNITNQPPRLRVYAHCTSTQKSSYPVGALTVYAMNLYEDEAVLTFDPILTTGGIDEYLMTPGDPDGLKSKWVSLNGKKLELVSDTELPEFIPRRLPASATVTLPSRTFAFYVLPGAKAQACLT